MSIVYNTATTANGYLADEDDSLEWLFQVGGETPDLTPFLAEVTVLVLGSTTYEWILRHEDLLDQPGKWRDFFDERPMFVFTSRTLPTPAGADVRFISGPVGDHVAEILEVAHGGVVWVQGGGDLAGQFFEAGALDRISLTVAPAFLAAGRPLFQRTAEPDRIYLESVEQVGQFARLEYVIKGQRNEHGAADLGAGRDRRGTDGPQLG